MARGDITLYQPTSVQPSIDLIVASGTTASIPAGTPTIGSDATAASWTGAVKAAADTDPTTASGHRFSGIAKSDSNETTTVAGTVSVWLPLPNTIYSAKAKTASLANTAALVNGLKLKRVIFDLTSAVWTIDTAAADAAANGILIVGGDFTTSTIYFLITTTVSVIGQLN